MEIRLFYSVPSLIICFFVLVALVKERSGAFQSTKYFYLLLIAQTIFNILTFMNSFYISTGTTTSMGSSLSFLYAKAPTFVCSFVYATTYHMVFVEMYMTFLISLYRMTMITHPVVHVKIWRVILPISITITLLSSLLCTYHLYVGNGFFEIINDYFYINSDTDVVRTLMTEMLIFLCVLMLVLLLVNVTSIVFVCIRTSVYNKSKLERNMLVLAFLDFLVKAAYFALYVVIYTNAATLGIAVKVHPYASDLLTFSNAYLLIILNKRVRERIRSLFRYPKKRQEFVVSKTFVANTLQQVR